MRKPIRHSNNSPVARLRGESRVRLVMVVTQERFPSDRRLRRRPDRIAFAIDLGSAWFPGCLVVRVQEVEPGIDVRVFECDAYEKTRSFALPDVTVGVIERVGTKAAKRSASEWRKPY